MPIAEKPIEAESAREPASVGQSGASVEQAGAVVDQPNAAVEQLNASADQHGPAVEDSNADSAANSLAEDGQPGSSGADSSDSAFGLKENEKGADFLNLRIRLWAWANPIIKSRTSLRYLRFRSLRKRPAKHLRPILV